MARRYAASDVSVDRYDDRRSEYASRETGRGRDYDGRYYEEDLEYRPRAAVRERDIRIREDVRIKGDRSRSRDRDRSPPEFLREDYGRTSAGPMVLRARETEDIEFVPKSRRRSPSPEPERKVEREEIIIRKDEPEQRPPPRRERDREVEREEIIIRRDDRERDKRRPPRGVDREREEIILKRDDGGRRSRYEVDYEKDDIISRRGDDRYDGRRGPPRDYDREEIIIRRDEREDDRDSRYGSRRADDYALARPKSHERERSRIGGRGSDSHEDEIIIRRDEREGRGGNREREEIIIRKHSHSRSPSPASSTRLPEPPIIRAPPIHQEIITHHRHVDHGYETALTPRIPSRPPSPPMPPRAHSEERIEIKRSGERNGRAYEEDIIIDRNEGGRSAMPGPPRSVRGGDDIYESPARRGPPRDYRDDRDVREEAEYYNNRALERSYPGEGLNGATRDWAIVDVPPGTERVRMDGIGGGGQEITWQRYNGVRRSKFIPNESDEGYGSEVGRPAVGGGEIGRRYGPPRRDPREGLWTEITKDLVLREAITEAGYDFEETEDFYYVIAYLNYEDVARLVGLSEDIRRDRRRRIREMEWENRVLPPPLVEQEPPRLAIEPLPRREREPWDREEDRYIEREIVYRGSRPPPPPQWR